MPAKIPLQSREARPPLHDLTHGGRGQGRADPLFPQPPEDCPFGDPRRLQPILQGEGSPIQHRLVRCRGCGDAGLLGLAVLQTVDIALFADTQAAELQRLVDQLRLQMSELVEQRDVELRRADRNEASRQQLDARLHEALETAKSEREDWAEYTRSVENRALSDVDRARQEVKELQVQLSKASEQHRALEKQLRQDIQTAQAAAATASQSADILRGRCDALEGQLSGLRDLPAQLEVAFKRSKEVRIAADVRPKRKRPKQ